MARKRETIGRGRVALVTGATGIIGPTICETLKRDGWRVAACASSKASFDSHTRVFRKPLAADAKWAAVLDGRESCRKLVRQIEKELGPVALLVNNAAANLKSIGLGELSEGHCDMMVKVNFLSPMWLIQAAEKSLIRQRGGIINISSVRVKKLIPKSILYPAMKAALEELTAVLAVELGPQGVRVNCIRVGAVPGPAFLRDTLARLPVAKARKLLAEIMPKHYAALAHLSATGRAGTALDVAEAVAFLASPKAEFFNGAVLPLDGGYPHQWENWPRAVEGWDSEKAVAAWLDREGIK